jgi:hypothetical protein
MSSGVLHAKCVEALSLVHACYLPLQVASQASKASKLLVVSVKNIQHAATAAVTPCWASTRHTWHDAPCGW